MITPGLSIVAPCYNETSCLDALYTRITAAARTAVAEDYELVLVDDGSSDDTWPLMCALASSDPHVMAISLSRNHGHQLALTAGLDLCSGRRILIIDADLQDPPELLPAMLTEMDRQQADVVYGVRRSRDGESAFKLASAGLFYRALSRLAEIEIPPDVGDFRLITRRALDALLSLPEEARFIRGMVAWIGFRQVPFAYDREQRHAGRTKYPLKKMVRLAADALTGFSTLPLRLAMHTAAALALLSIFLLLYIVERWWHGRTVEGWPSLMAVVIVLGAAQMGALAMIGEYLGRVYEEVKRRPLYIVSDVVGRTPSAPVLGHLAQPRETIASSDSPGGSGTRPIT